MVSQGPSAYSGRSHMQSLLLDSAILFGAVLLVTLGVSVTTGGNLADVSRRIVDRWHIDGMPWLLFLLLLPPTIIAPILAWQHYGVILKRPALSGHNLWILVALVSWPYVLAMLCSFVRAGALVFFWLWLGSIAIRGIVLPLVTAIVLVRYLILFAVGGGGRPDLTWFDVVGTSLGVLWSVSAVRLFYVVARYGLPM